MIDKQRKDFNQSNKVMVYGTLRKGMGNHQSYLMSSKFLGEFEVPNFIMWTDRGSTIPFISSINNDRYSILVEAYEIDSFKTFLDLDTLEGHPDFYERILINHKNESYWIYTIPKDERGYDYSIIEDGDYVNWYRKLKNNNRLNHSK